MPYSHPCAAQHLQLCRMSRGFGMELGLCFRDLGRAGMPARQSLLRCLAATAGLGGSRQGLGSSGVLGVGCPSLCCRNRASPIAWSGATNLGTESIQKLPCLAHPWQTHCSLLQPFQMHLAGARLCWLQAGSGDKSCRQQSFWPNWGH